MAIDKERVVGVVYEVVDEINESILKENKLDKTCETVLLGEGGKLDSLGIVTLITAIEQKIEDEFGVLITLADENAMSQVDSPFETIGKLADYISLLLDKK